MPAVQPAVGPGANPTAHRRLVTRPARRYGDGTAMELAGTTPEWSNRLELIAPTDLNALFRW